MSIHQRSQVLVILLVSYVMIILDISIVITGLPSIQKTMGFSMVGLSWVQNAYLLCFGGFLLPAARAGDVFGRKLMFMFGLLIFTSGSFVIGVAQIQSLLIGARALQGIGAAILAPSILALISSNFREGAERTQALAYYSMAAGVGASLGLVLGGIFADAISWRVGFLMNVPLGIVLWITANRAIPETERNEGALDITSSITSILGMGALVYGIVNSVETGWSDIKTELTVGFGFAILTIFFVHQSRTKYPILPLRLFASRERSGAYAARMLFLGAMVSFFYFTTQYLQSVLGYTAMQAGIAFLPMTIPTFAAAMAVPWLTRRVGNAGLMSLSFVLAAAGMVWLGQAGSNPSFVSNIAFPMILIGLGNGGALGPLTVAGVAGVEARDHGAASGLINTAHQLGGSLGLGILIVVFALTEVPVFPVVNILNHRIDAAITGGGIIFVFAFIVFIALIVPAERARNRVVSRFTNFT